MNECGGEVCWRCSVCLCVYLLRAHGYLKHTLVVFFSLWCSSMRLSGSCFFIWFALIPFSSSNPPCSPSSSQTSSALCFPPALPFPPLRPRPPPSDRRWLDCCIARRSCVFSAVLIHLAASPHKHVVAHRRLDRRSVGTGAWTTRPSVGGPPPWHRQTLWGQMVQRQRPLLIKCARSPSLAVAPSAASQWKQRKLAPNYRLVSVKDGSGAAGVSVCEGWVAESLRDRGLPCA